jgi:hypothetical protein
MMPWFGKLLEEDILLIRHHWWSYGLEENRKAADTFLRYHYEQGLSKRRLTCEESL